METPEATQAVKKTDLARELFDWAQSLVNAIVAIVVIFAFIACVYSVRQSSMDDTLHEGQMLLISNLFYTPQHGDIVMFTEYGNPVFLNEETGQYNPFVKRVIGIPGDVIDFKAGTLFINGEAQVEPYILEQSYRWKGDMEVPFTVPEGQYFMVGDNRNGSHDSRYTDIGFVDRRAILGRVLLRLSPLSKFGPV